MDKENQDRIIIAFLEKAAKRVEKETGIKRWECLVDDEDPIGIGDEDTGVYVIGNKSFDPSMILEVNVEPEKSLVVCIYNHNLAFFKNMLESIIEELPKVAKELKINHFEINF